MILLLTTLACGHRDSGAPSKPDDTDTGVAPDSPATETETSPPDTDTDTGDTQDTGETGDSDTNVDTAPPPCDRSLGWKFVECGFRQTCGIHTDGCAECWGRGEAESHPETDTGWLYHWHGEDLPPPGEYQAISMVRTVPSETDPSTPNACGILSDGTAVCWGSEYFGINDVPGGTYSDLSVTYGVAYGIGNDGVAAEWGYYHTPPSGTFSQVESGFDDLLLTTSGTLVQTGMGPSDDIVPPLGTFTDIGIGEAHACAIKAENGSILCWDQFDPSNAEFDDMTTSAPDGPFVDVCVMSTSFGCALDATGRATCWPYDGIWAAPEGEVFTQIACGGWHTCGVTVDNRILCWGSDDYGETIPPT